MGGGTIATEIGVQGVQNRLRHTYRFPLETTILGEIAQIKGDPRVGQHIVSGLAMMAWTLDHEAVYEGTTPEAQMAFDRGKIGSPPGPGRSGVLGAAPHTTIPCPTSSHS